MAVTLDTNFVKQAGIEPGQTISMVYDVDNNVFSGAKTKEAHTTEAAAIKASTKTAVLQSKITDELHEWTKTFIKENEESLKKLADL